MQDAPQNPGELVSKKGALKSCSDTCLMILFHVPSRVRSPLPLSPKTVLHILHAPKEPYEIPPSSII